MRYKLYQNYPNPFNALTTIPFTLNRSEKVRLVVYNQLGQQVMTLIDKNMGAGQYSILWNADNLSSGVYLLELETPEFSLSRKAIFIK